MTPVPPSEAQHYPIHLKPGSNQGILVNLHLKELIHDNNIPESKADLFQAAYACFFDKVDFSRHLKWYDNKLKHMVTDKPNYIGAVSELISTAFLQFVHLRREFRIALEKDITLTFTVQMRSPAESIAHTGSEFGKVALSFITPTGEVVNSMLLGLTSLTGVDTIAGFAIADGQRKKDNLPPKGLAEGLNDYAKQTIEEKLNLLKQAGQQLRIEPSQQRTTNGDCVQEVTIGTILDQLSAIGSATATGVVQSKTPKIPKPPSGITVGAQAHTTLPDTTPTPTPTLTFAPREHRTAPVTTATLSPLRHTEHPTPTPILTRQQAEIREKGYPHHYQLGSYSHLANAERVQQKITGAIPHITTTLVKDGDPYLVWVASNTSLKEKFKELGIGYFERP